MGVFSEWINEIGNVQRKINEIILEVVRDHEMEIIKLNVEDQLYDKGVDGNGNKLNPPYAESTKVRKRKKGQPTNRVTLKDSGEFYKGFYLWYEEDGFSIQVDDIKTKYLVNRYGKDIAGLDRESMDKMRRMIGEKIIVKIQKMLRNG